MSTLPASMTAVVIDVAVRHLDGGRHGDVRAHRVKRAAVRHQDIGGRSLNGPPAVDVKNCHPRSELGNRRSEGGTRPRLGATRSAACPSSLARQPRLQERNRQIDSHRHRQSPGQPASISSPIDRMLWWIRPEPWAACGRGSLVAGRGPDPSRRRSRTFSRTAGREVVRQFRALGPVSARRYRLGGGVSRPQVPGGQKSSSWMLSGSRNTSTDP
jgi:hypothetical protein